MACSLENTRKQMISLKLINEYDFVEKEESETRDRALMYARDYKLQAKNARASKNFAAAKEAEKASQEFIDLANKEFETIPKEILETLKSYSQNIKSRTLQKYYSLPIVPGTSKTMEPFQISKGKVIFNQSYFDWVDKINADRDSLKGPGVQLDFGFLQKESTARASEVSAEDLNNTIKTFLSKIGVSVNAVDELRDSNGNTLNGIAVANMLDKVIQVVDGKAGVDTLSEEASHFFVEMLPRDSHLFKVMYDSIEDYQVYSQVLEEYGEDPLYKGNIDKLKREAMAKLITSHIIDNYTGTETPANVEKAYKWWNLLWNWLTKKLFNFNKEGFYDTAKKANAFEVSAEMIIQGDVSQLREVGSVDLFKQKKVSNEEALKVKTLIESEASKLKYDKDYVHPRTKKKGTYFYKASNEASEKVVSKRTTDIIEILDKQRGWAERTEQQKESDKYSALAGDKVHAALKNIINRYSEKLQDAEVTMLNRHGITEAQYSLLKTYVDTMFKKYPPGSLFLPEITVYNKEEDIAGTIDLLIIKPDGTIDIFDWKTTNLEGKSSIPYYKEENWNVQLTSYKNSLESYGLTKFGRIRVIPISTKFDKQKNLQSISIGSNKLEQIPITGLKGGDIEFTGNERVDKLIEVLAARLKKVAEIKVPYGDIKKQQLKIARIENLKASIKDLQLKESYEAFLEEATFELNLLANSGLSSYDNDEILEARNAVTFYARILENRLISKESLKDNYEAFSEVQASASSVLADINQEVEKRAIDVAQSVGIKDILEPQEEPHVLARWFRSISQFNQPIIKAFYKLVSNQKDKVYKDSKDLQNKIEESVKILREWSESKGVSGTDIFNPFLKMGKDGKWTGDLINKYDAEFYAKKEKAVQDKNEVSLKWLRENINFDEAAFNKMRTESIATWEKLHKKDKNKEAILKKKLNDFDVKFNVRTHPYTAYANKKNFLITPKEKWYSEKYKEIMSTPALKQFYELFTSTIKENSEYLDLKLGYSFVPNVHNDLVDSIAQNGFFSVSGLKESFEQAISVKSDSGYGMVDETTGEVKKQIPIYYTSQIPPQTKSKDLGRSLFLFANMSLNHKYMSEIEASTKMLQDVLDRSSKTILTDAQGNPVKNPLTKKVQQVLNSNDSLDMFNKYMDYYLYGITSSGTDKPISIKGKNISSKKLLSQSLKWYSAKSLSLNLISGFANAFGGTANALMEGSKGRFYTSKEYRNSLLMMGSNSFKGKESKPFMAIEFWDVESNKGDLQRANKLSASSISKNFTFDKFYLLQQKGEWVVENSVLLSMLQSHTIKDGVIVKKKDSDKSLLDLMEVKDDKIQIEGLTDNEYSKFRRKVKYLYSTMKGNMNADDISLSKVTLFGQVMMQFKNWIPRMADERFGNLRYTEDLGVWEQGKYKTTWNHITSTSFKNFSNLVTGLFANGLLGIGGNFGVNSIKEAAERHYDTLPEAQKQKMSREEYAEMYLGNLKASATEIQLILGAIALLAVLKGDDDDTEEKSAFERYLIKQVKRNLDELAFFVSPESAASTIGYGKPVVPLLGLLVDIGNVFADFGGQTVGFITQDKEQMEKNRPVGRLLNLFPATNALEKWWREFIDEED